MLKPVLEVAQLKLVILATPVTEATKSVQM
jgi:hypothetical protein